MSLDQWLLALHVSGAFLLIGGAVVAGVLRVLAQRSERPSEVALFLGLIRFALAAIGAGVAIAFVLGLWLVDRLDYSFGKAWIVVSLLLWVAANAFGAIGGRRERAVRELAEQLAATGDTPSGELRARLRDPVALAFSTASGLGFVAILALMIWRPGA
jgi:uncharacterized membrane protein